MNRKLPLLIFLIFFFTGKSFSQTDTAHVGLFITSLYDFSIDGKSFNTDFWLWINYNDDSLAFEEIVEIPDAKNYEYTMFSVEKKGNINWATMKCKAEMKKDWDVTDFPFDDQVLTITLEDSELDTTSLVYVADAANSKIDPQLKMNEWAFDSFTVNSMFHSYNTTYGDPELSGASTYPAITAKIYMHRTHSWLILMKMLTGVYVAFFISILVFFIKPSITDRFGLCVGGLFAAVGNKYITESIVPATVTNTLIDNVHNITLLSILFIIAVSVITLRWDLHNDPKSYAYAKRIERVCFVVLTSLYVTLNIGLILNAQ